MSASEASNGTNIISCSKDSNFASSNKKSGHSSSSDSSPDGEEQDDSSSSSNSFYCEPKIHQDVEEELSNFRQLWKKDISVNCNRSKRCNLTISVDQENNRENEEIELKAKKWFVEGVEHEKNGRLLDAIHFYKKAVQLVPDIEFKLCDSLGHNQAEICETNNFSDFKNEDVCQRGVCVEDESEHEEENDDLNLILKLQRFIATSKAICSPASEQKSTHISSLPMEIILYILRWVVSHDLDLRSLEMCSMVCRGFYLCSRDPEIWRLACLKVWGMNCGTLKNYDSWRMMFLKRPRLNYNGCYISKTTYIRHGETSFQDQFYRPWHVVEYYRYFRFFPEGTVYMLTTPDKPTPVTCLLKGRENRHPSLLSGHYRLQDDKVMIVLQREDLISNRLRRRKSNLPLDLVEQKFHIVHLLPEWSRKKYYFGFHQLNSNERRRRIL